MTQEQKLQIYSAYLPYGLKVAFNDDQHEHQLVGMVLDTLHIVSPFGDYGTAHINTAKPILRPMSDLTKEIVHPGYNDGKPSVPIAEIRRIYPNTDNFRYLTERVWDHYCQVGFKESFIEWCVMEKLFEWHFNCLGLPETEYIVKQ